MGLHGPLSITAGHLQLSHLRDVLPVGVVILGLLLVCQLADVVRGFLRVEAGHARGAEICHLTKREKDGLMYKHQREFESNLRVRMLDGSGLTTLIYT